MPTMPDLTKELIEEIRHYGTHIIGYEKRTETIIALCDLALKGLTITRPEASFASPAGWKLVPIEPTEAMLDAARLLDAFPGESDEAERITFLNDCARANYQAMLEAVPLANSPLGARKEP